MSVADDIHKRKRLEQTERKLRIGKRKWYGWIAILSLLLLIFACCEDIPSAIVLANRCSYVTGSVIETDVDRGRSGVSVMTTYQYTVGGKTYQKTGAPGPPNENVPSAFSDITVFYSPANPAVSSVTRPRIELSSDVTNLFVVAVLLCYIGVTIRPGRPKLRRRRALSSSQPSSQIASTIPDPSNTETPKVSQRSPSDVPPSFPVVISPSFYRLPKRPVKRRGRARRKRRPWVVVAGFVAVPIMIAFCLFVHYGVLNLERFADVAHKTDGTVSSAEYGGNTEWIRYSYRVNGKAYGGLRTRQDADGGLVYHQTGDPVDVYYDPVSPSDSTTIEPHRYAVDVVRDIGFVVWEFGMIVGGFALFLACKTPVFLSDEQFATWRRSRKQHSPRHPHG